MLASVVLYINDLGLTKNIPFRLFLVLLFAVLIRSELQTAGSPNFTNVIFSNPKFILPSFIDGPQGVAALSLALPPVMRSVLHPTEGVGMGVLTIGGGLAVFIGS